MKFCICRIPFTDHPGELTELATVCSLE